MEYFHSEHNQTVPNDWEYDSTETWNKDTTKTQSFQDWADSLIEPILGYNDNVYLKDNTISGHNNFALQTYMFNQFWEKDYLNIGYNNSFTLNYSFTGLPNEIEASDTEAKIIKYNPKSEDSILNKPARYNGEEYWINNL